MEISLPRPIIIVANRKMNADKSSLEAWREAMQESPLLENIITITALPSPYLAGGYLPDSVALGAQDCHAESAGAFTGSVSASMLADVGVEYVIVGHSERRAVGDSNSDVRQKAEAVLSHNMKPIICVGEDLPTRESNKAEAYVTKQLKESCPAGDVIIAYEPIWAIGTGKSASATDAQTMHANLRQVVGESTPILYGGSVTPDNAKEYMQQSDIDGVLVGSACLDPKSFIAIINASI